VVYRVGKTLTKGSRKEELVIENKDNSSKTSFLKDHGSSSHDHQGNCGGNCSLDRSRSGACALILDLGGSARCRCRGVGGRRGGGGVNNRGGGDRLDHNRILTLDRELSRVRLQGLGIDMQRVS